MVEPLRALTVGSLFTGYGGLEMGIDRALGGIDVRWHADNAPAPAAILAHRYPNVPNLGDVRTIDYTQPELGVDIIACGFPCQDVSAAGHKRGTTGTRTRLYTYAVDAIAAIRPKLVVAENVRGLLIASGTTPQRTGYGDVLSALTGIGYDAAWIVVPASDIGAPHRRARVFVIAWPATANAPSVEWRQRRRLRARNETELRRRLTTDRASASPAQPPANTHARQAFPFRHYAPAIEHWERLTGAPAPDVFVDSTLRVTPAFTEWLMGVPAGYVSDVPGITRKQAVEALGNGVVPAQAAHAITHLLDAVTPL